MFNSDSVLGNRRGRAWLLVLAGWMFVLLIILFRNRLLSGAFDATVDSGFFALRCRFGGACIVFSLFPFLNLNGRSLSCARLV